jgi:uncharacterized protein (DUF362 family)
LLAFDRGCRIIQVGFQHGPAYQANTMNNSSDPNDGCVSRRGFLFGMGAGLTGAASLAWFAQRPAAQEIPLGFGSSTAKPVGTSRLAHGIPGPFPGRVVEIHHPGSVRDDNTICAQSVPAMMDRGMRELTGAEHVSEAWRRFFEPGDVVGIKVNPVGRKYRPTQVASISSPPVLLQVVEGLKSAGVKPRDIIVFERYADQFRDAGYEAVLRERGMEGVHWYASSDRYDNSQLDIAGHVTRADRFERDPHVVGYDPDVFVHMDYANEEHDIQDDRRFRSHLSLVVTKMVNKFVTIPVLKDHRSAGVTLALKNLSHGLNNNVARSHLSTVRRRDGWTSGPNQCDTFIPSAVDQEPIRRKATLHVMDGLIAVYEGGPASRYTWRHRSLFFATDPVALDHVGWDIIDAQRARFGLAPVAQTGALHITPAMRQTTWLTTLGGQSPTEALILAAAGRDLYVNRQTEVFDRRQPEHVILAGTIGLGIFDANQIDHRRVNLPA